MTVGKIRPLSEDPGVEEWFDRRDEQANRFRNPPPGKTEPKRQTDFYGGAKTRGTRKRGTPSGIPKGREKPGRRKLPEEVQEGFEEISGDSSPAKQQGRGDLLEEARSVQDALAAAELTPGEFEKAATSPAILQRERELNSKNQEPALPRNPKQLKQLLKQLKRAKRRVRKTTYFGQDRR
ncbi:hypothetical protein B5M47_00905 [candidate division CPR3 bacterium 4484_211]|uniref:Uncharacterized protein n=1 Tax=candidate division CPR3 bacterium 4484_211 TaxID=1968527 RepID=A0A1W9NZ74_UNCC3|nr:MAG: hypothetical protein B5M47_00905 [candidate division CPR3 bacterium 4484_211]